MAYLSDLDVINYLSDNRQKFGVSLEGELTRKDVRIWIENECVFHRAIYFWDLHASDMCSARLGYNTYRANPTYYPDLYFIVPIRYERARSDLPFNAARVARYYIYEMGYDMCFIIRRYGGAIGCDHGTEQFLIVPKSVKRWRNWNLSELADF